MPSAQEPSHGSYHRKSHVMSFHRRDPASPETQCPFPSLGASGEGLGPSCEQTHSQPLARAHRAILQPCHLPSHETQNSLDLRVPLKDGRSLGAGVLSALFLHPPGVQCCIWPEEEPGQDCFRSFSDSLPLGARSKSLGTRHIPVLKMNGYL